MHRGCSTMHGIASFCFSSRVIFCNDLWYTAAVTNASDLCLGSMESHAQGPHPLSIDNALTACRLPQASWTSSTWQGSFFLVFDIGRQGTIRACYSTCTHHLLLRNGSMALRSLHSFFFFFCKPTEAKNSLHSLSILNIECCVAAVQIYLQTQLIQETT